MQRGKRVARVNTVIVASSSDAMLFSVSMLTLLPYPDVLGVVAAAASVLHRQLSASTKSGSVLTATGLGLKPRRAMQAAAHALVRAAANAKRRIEAPA